MKLFFLLLALTGLVCSVNGYVKVPTSEDSEVMIFLFKIKPQLPSGYDVSRDASRDIINLLEDNLSYPYFDYHVQILGSTDDTYDIILIVSSDEADTKAIASVIDSGSFGRLDIIEQYSVNPLLYNSIRALTVAVSSSELYKRKDIRYCVPL